MLNFARRPLRLLALRLPPSRQQRAAFAQAATALYRLVEPMCTGVDAVEYAERIITHPSPVLRAHARARLERQRERLTADYQAADKALEAVIRVMERSQ
jgi:hypothetical protein